MKQYKDAFTPVPEETLARVEDTLRHLPQREERTSFRLRRRWAVTLAFALALALCGGAVAASRLGVLDFLFGATGNPTEEQQRLVQDVNLTHKADMATITVTDAIFDGRQLSMGLIFETDQPTYALSEGVWLNGTLVSDNDLSAHFGWPNKSNEHRLSTSGLTAITDETLTGQIEVRLRVMLLQPRKAVKTFAEGDYDSMDALREAARQAAEDGYTPVYAEGWSPVSIDLLSSPRYDTKTDYPYSRRFLSTAETHNMNVEEVWLTFTVEGNPAYTGETVHLDVVNNDELPFTVMVRRAEMTLVGSHFVLDIYPKEGGLERPVDLQRVLALPDRYFENEAVEIFFQSTSTNYGRGGWMIDAEGDMFYRLVHETGPIQELPEKLYLVFDSVPSFRPLWQWAIELCPADAPDTRESPPAESTVLPDETTLFYFHLSDATVEDGMIRCEARLSAFDGTNDYQALWQRWIVCDLDGHPLDMGSGQTSIEESDDGGELFVITQDVLMPEEIPDAVYLIPIDPDTGAANREYAIMLPVAQE